MNFFYAFKDAQKATIEEVGSKGLSLIKAYNNGYNVPNGIVLTTSFFESWIKEIEASQQWKNFENSLNEKDTNAIKELCCQLSFNNQQQAALNEIRSFSNTDDLFAVRSSSPEEDLEGASFAGIYESILGVSDDKLDDAMRTCFSSVFDERVISYKKSRGYNYKDAKIAVIIQRQLASDISGVAFTLNPATNYYDETVINANFGLGDTVVDGSISADQFTVDKLTNRIIDKNAGSKESSNFIQTEGSVEQKNNNAADILCLSDKQVLEVNTLACKIEKEYGKPMDIEWAFEKDELYLLQARPVTGFLKLPPDVLTIPGEQKRLYADVLLTQQGLIKGLSPLGEGVIELFYSDGMKAMGMEASLTEELVAITGGRWYSNVGLGMKMSGKKAVLQGIENVDATGCQILKQMDLKPYIPKKAPKGILKSFIKIASSSLKVISGSRKAYKNPDQYLEYFLAENDKLAKALHNTFEKNLSFIDFTKKALDMLNRWLNGISVPTAYATMMARSKIKKMFRHEDPSVTDRLALLERAFPHNVTIEMGDLLYELAQFQEIKQIDEADVFVKKLEKKQFSNEFMEKWKLFMNKYGFRCPRELDIATPRYYDKPEDIFALLKTMHTGNNPETTPKAIFDKGVEKREETFQFFLNILKTGRQVKLFKKRYKVLETFVSYREIHKYYMVMAIDLIRRKALDTAGSFVKDRCLDKEADIFYLHIEEVSSALEDRSIVLLHLIQKNRSFYNQFKTGRMLPSLIDSRGFIPTLRTEKTNENELLGTPVSPGIVTGPVKVLSRPDEKAVLPGDILVAEATDPGWTTLFINAAGILIQNGGVLQHGASVARESCKPCIVGIEHVTEILEDGQVVELDGSTGFIKILK